MKTVNLTCMLVLTTIFIDVLNNLPKTSYMKMIDMWLFFTLLQPFIVFLLHTYMDTLREENEECEVSDLGGQNAEKLNSVRGFAIFTNPDLCYKSAARNLKFYPSIMYAHRKHL